jgi:hypothetical protein
MAPCLSKGRLPSLAVASELRDVEIERSRVAVATRGRVSQQDLNASLPEGPFDLAPRATDCFRVAGRSARRWGFDAVSYENSMSLRITGLLRNRRR